MIRAESLLWGKQRTHSAKRITRQKKHNRLATDNEGNRGEAEGGSPYLKTSEPPQEGLTGSVELAK